VRLETLLESLKMVKHKLIYEVPKWALPFGYGIALWKIALVRKDSKNLAYVKAHEWKHLLQFKELGFWKFIFQYCKELCKVGYKNNRFEVEARAYGTMNQHRFKDV
jgi:hypothetical protein